MCSPVLSDNLSSIVVDVVFELFAMTFQPGHPIAGLECYLVCYQNASGEVGSAEYSYAGVIDLLHPLIKDLQCLVINLFCCTFTILSVSFISTFWDVGVAQAFFH